MQRKIVEQGAGAHTISLPVQWIRSHNLKPGDNLEIQNFDDDLLISSSSKKQKKKSITMTFKRTRESAHRTFLANAYRAGFDSITLMYNGKEKDIRDIVDHFMIGFELFKQADGTYLIESISEPSYDNFENIILKQFFLIEEILNDITNKELEIYVYKVQKYDNFLKRCLSKQIFSIQANMFLWQFLSYLAQIARLCLHFHRDLPKNLDKEQKRAVQNLLNMFTILHKAYVKKDYSLLPKLHLMEQEYKKKRKNRHGLFYHHVTLLVRVIYISNSPLMGLLQ
jgi:hypothetical protein